MPRRGARAGGSGVRSPGSAPAQRGRQGNTTTAACGFNYMRIDIWSDVVCPWCSIGKRRLERALADFPHRDQVEVVYHSFLLDPGAPTEPTGTAQEMLARKYGMTLAEAAEKQSAVIAVAAELGMDWGRHHESPHVGTVDAHRLLHLALAEGGPAPAGRAQGRPAPGLLRRRAQRRRPRRAARGRDSGSASTPSGSTRSWPAMSSPATSPPTLHRPALTVRPGVPFFVVDEKYGVSGAQPTELFAQLLERAWTEGDPPRDGPERGGRRGLRSRRLSDLTANRGTSPRESGDRPVESGRLDRSVLTTRRARSLDSRNGGRRARGGRRPAPA